MKHMPPELSSYLRDLPLQDRSPAYLLIGRNENLEDLSGDLSPYGLSHLDLGKPAIDQLPFLQGLLPLRQTSLALSCVQINDGLWTDIHIIRAGRQHWVLFLALTEEELLHHRLFEKANEYSVLRDKHTSILDQYLGRELVKALDDGQIVLCESGERRQVSILFADIRGFTSFSEANAPEVVFATLNRYLDAMIPPLIEESAVVDKILGDAVMGVFGILTMSVSPPHQAVVAAMKILDAVRDLNRRLCEEGKPFLEVGIGISTGPVAVGILGSSARKSFSVVGHHVNLSARLQENAVPLEVLVDENTYQEIVAYQGGFQATSIKLKGITDPVRVYSYRMSGE